MIIKWKKSNPKVIPVLGNLKGKTGQIKSQVLLLEGINVVKDEEWELASQNLDDRIDMPFIEVIDDRVEIEDPKNPKKKIVKSNKGLEKFEAKEAKEMVEDCFNVKTLEFWLENEGRNEIRSLLHEKLDDIKNNNLTKDKQDKRKKSKKKGK